jgi:hypothetical protein
MLLRTTKDEWKKMSSNRFDGIDPIAMHRDAPYAKAKEQVALKIENVKNLLGRLEGKLDKLSPEEQALLKRSPEPTLEEQRPEFRKLFYDVVRRGEHEVLGGGGKVANDYRHVSVHKPVWKKHSKYEIENKTNQVPSHLQDIPIIQRFNEQGYKYCELPLVLPNNTTKPLKECRVDFGDIVSFVVSVNPYVNTPSGTQKMGLGLRPVNCLFYAKAPQYVPGKDAIASFIKALPPPPDVCEYECDEETIRIMQQITESDMRVGASSTTVVPFTGSASSSSVPSTTPTITQMT